MTSTWSLTATATATAFSGDLAVGAVNVVDARRWSDDECRSANLVRPIVREHRVVFLLGLAQVDRFVGLAPDFYDWFSTAQGLLERDGRI